MSRLRIFILFAALLALATAFAACGGGDGSPEAVLDDATFKGIESGDIDLSLTVDSKGEEGGKLDVSLSGPFENEAKGQPPRLSLEAKANGSLGGEKIDFEGGLVLLPSKAYVSYEGTNYEVDPTTFSFVKSTLEEAQQREGGESADVTACQEAASELEVGDFVDNLTDDGSAKVGGTSTTKISGDLDVPGAIDALTEISDEPACQSQLSEEGGPFALDGKGVEEAKEQLESSVESAPVEVSVGKDDIVRQVVTKVAIEPEQSSGSGPDSIDLAFDLTLTGVNEEQSIAAPPKSKPLNDLFLKLGINPLELLSLLEGQGGAGGIAGLLDQLGGSGSSGGSSEGSGSSGGGQSYTECLQDARSAADIQKCGSQQPE